MHVLNQNFIESPSGDKELISGVPFADTPSNHFLSLAF